MCPVLVVFGGLPGSGKSAAARLISERTGWQRVSSDVIRLELFPARTYSADESACVYQTIVDRVVAEIHGGRSVIVDASHITQPVVWESILPPGVGVRRFWLSCSDEVAERRLAGRIGDESEADIVVRARLVGRVGDLAGWDVVDTTGWTVGDVADLVLGRCCSVGEGGPDG